MNNHRIQYDELLFAVGNQADIITRLRALVRAYRAHHDLPGPDQFHAVLEAEHALEPGYMELTITAGADA